MNKVRFIQTVAQSVVGRQIQRKIRAQKKPSDGEHAPLAAYPAASRLTFSRDA